ncbi:MAG: hypothetical protein LW712_11210 [Burkholderiaceae bacterium]|nr:hypothetical protein [Burkholderiaceae bacterium]
MSKLAAAGAERRHPQPAELLEFVRRHAMTLRYIEATAAWVRDTYPASAGELVPKLRELYAERRQKLPY